MKKWIAKLELYVDKPWYPPLLAFIATIDAFLIVIPTDILLISSVLLVPRKWISLFVWLAIGSSLSVLIIASLTETQGLPFLLKYFPHLLQSEMWAWSDQFMHHYGIWAIFLIALSPIMQHPMIALAGLAQLPLAEIALMYFAGRFIKYAIVAWVTAHAPHLLKKAKVNS